MIKKQINYYLYDLIGDDKNEIIDDLGNEIDIFVYF